MLDDKAWADGFEGRWADTKKELAFAFQKIVTRPVYLNTNLVQESELRTLDDLVNSKWKGKIAVGDVRQGYVRTPISVLRQVKGDEFVKKLVVDQQPEFIRDRRQLVEALVRGRQPVGYGLHPRVLEEFREQGVAGHVKNLGFPETDYSGGDVVAVFNKAPHPNAAKLFVNWLLTKEGGAQAPRPTARVWTCRWWTRRRPLNRASATRTRRERMSCTSKTMPTSSSTASSPAVRRSKCPEPRPGMALGSRFENNRCTDAPRYKSQGTVP